MDDDPLDVTPQAATMNMMDPYELFSTPPSEMIFTSTPTKAKSETRQYSAKKQNEKEKEKEREKLKQKEKLKKKRKTKNQKKTDLWDKCLKSDPKLAEFVDNFNQSVEEALSKPLDIEGNE